MAVVLLFSIPMYLCATGSIPIAAALMLKGLSPGAALVLLMAGPATNTASILVIGKVLGRRTLAAYLGAIVAGAVGFGWRSTICCRQRGSSLRGRYMRPATARRAIRGWRSRRARCSAALLAYAPMKRFIHRKNDTSMTKQIYRVGHELQPLQGQRREEFALLPSVTAVEVDLTAGTVAVEGRRTPPGFRR